MHAARECRSPNGGRPPGRLRAVLEGRPEAMPADVALVWRFTCAMLAHDGGRHVSRGDRQKMGSAGNRQPRVRDRRRAAVSDGQIRHGSRQGLHPRHRGRRHPSMSEVNERPCPGACQPRAISGGETVMTDPAGSFEPTGRDCSGWRIGCSGRLPRPRMPFRTLTCAGTKRTASGLRSEGLSDDDDDADLP